MGAKDELQGLINPIERPEDVLTPSTCKRCQGQSNIIKLQKHNLNYGSVQSYIENQNDSDT